MSIIVASGWTPVAMAAPARAAKASQPEPFDPLIVQALRDKTSGSLKKFYAGRGFRPLWFVGDRIGPQADTLLGYLASADLDGLKPSSYKVADLQAALLEARSGNPTSIARAELKLSAAFTRYVRDQRRSRGDTTIYADGALKPMKLRPEAVLRAAAFPKSFPAYLTDMGWMSTHYVRLRELMMRDDANAISRDVRSRLRRNLDRARVLPGPWTRHIVVDASSGRLWYYEAGKQVGTMRVVVGAKATQTPMLAGTLQWAILNPYWNVPTYLARDKIAPKILAGRSLASMKMEALSDWSLSARTLNASDVDWQAVASGAEEIRLRELPGAANSMGRMKFLFPNEEGIYLHDTPDKDLLKKPDRHLSNGCIRLEKAAELGRWLLQRPVKAVSKDPEQAVPLPVQVPVYLTYLTATATDSGVAFRDDVYGRDE